MLNTVQVAALPDPPVTSYTVRREIERGNLQAEKVSGVWVVTEAEGRRWASAFQPYAGLRKHHTAKPAS